ncbi:MAG: isopentenyl phosphate kinase family protein [Anaerolineales bacterium]|nr:isopentenyl phosphate kinase family protein [Anaerolineales bacterium]
MLVFLKLGGSLITDKKRPYTPRMEVLDDLATQVAVALQDDPDLQLVLGHGSGSFGHAAASQHGTLRGVAGFEAWRGFTEVWYQAAALDRLVVDALRRAGLATIALAPVAAVIARDNQVASWDLRPLQAALTNRLLPVIYGDVIFDQARGGTILSTEDLFVHLTRHLHPGRILLAGQEIGVWENFPNRQRLVAEITPGTFAQQAPGLGAAAGMDVTGGMESKVRKMLALVEEIPNLQVLIFSGDTPGTLLRAMRGENPGTLLHR